MLRNFLLSAIVLSVSIPLAAPHGDHGEEAPGSCEVSPDVRVVADYLPGIITVDGHADEWGGVDGFELDLLPALDPDADKAYAGGKMSIKAAHDGSRIFFMLQVDGEYAYSQGVNQKCSSVALMFQVGENASYHNMGGCKEMPGSCNNVNCRGHEVDIMHFSIGSAIPGRLYGSNPVDNSNYTGGNRFAHLVDEYAWNPHCKYLDGKGPSAVQKEKNDGKIHMCQDSFKTERWMYVYRDYLILKGKSIPKSYTMITSYEELHKYGLNGVAQRFIKPSVNFIKGSLRMLGEIENVYGKTNVQLANLIAQIYWSKITHVTRD